MTETYTAIPDEQFEEWLKSMKPFLQNACSPYYAICQAGLVQHKDVIYRKYAQKDWFREKIDIFRQEPGELVNDTIVSLVRNINEKAKRKEALTHDEIDILKFYAEKGRSAQPFFVNRQETTVVPPIEDVIHKLESDNIDDVADNIKKELAGTNEQPTTTPTAEEQMVENNPPVQNQEQAGTGSDLQAQPNSETPPAGSTWT